ncbi:MAG: tRNA 5-methoxyuridine(34)/uridine 5-oxyacetic acid(34) synthase CmoB [Proteobacteria bacterium]|nr:tRNA 5-methoxyuridine(34)/uridine 5-oxyacetic acid(34) synthase CmoB [Pseudomonadota bacterium]
MHNNYIEYLNTPHQEKIRLLQEENDKWLALPKKGITRYLEPLRELSHIRAKHLDVSGDVVKIGARDELTSADQQKIHTAMRNFMPWRKGPFEIFGLEIDSEWQSQRKWNRVLPVLPDLEGKIIADIGCNNGYYMFRMAAFKPKYVIGFEPYLHYYFTFKTLNTFAGLDNLFIERMGVEQIGLFENSFDVVFLMGILYHRSSPVETLKDIFTAMRPGGTLIVESQGIPGNDPMAIFPEERYAKVPGTYFVPTAACLKNWMTRSGFTEVEIFDHHPMTNTEQRRTQWMEFESYDDFIDPKDPTRTIEGYPAPIRVYLKGKKSG